MISIKLKEPIQAHGEEITVLKLKDPKAKHYRKMDFSKIDRTVDMCLDFASVLAGVPPSALDELCRDDTMALVEAVGPLLGKSLKTG